jgi:16S rRNA (uracil1498-N3)-methyltransferase
MIAVLVPPGALAPGAVLRLEPEEARHLQARRVAPGDPVTLLDGRGGRAAATLEPAPGGWRALVCEVRSEPRPPTFVLAVGAGDRDRFADLVERAAEFGATAVVPLETERSRSVASRVRPGHLARLRRRAREALKQCRGTWAPEVLEPLPLAALRDGARGMRWLADAAGGAPGPLAMEDDLTVAIGPEGGFTEAEREAMVAAGFLPIRLGPRVLRFDTAAVAAAAAVHLLRRNGEAR